MVDSSELYQPAVQGQALNGLTIHEIQIWSQSGIEFVDCKVHLPLSESSIIKEADMISGEPISILKLEWCLRS